MVVIDQVGNENILLHWFGMVTNSLDSVCSVHSYRACHTRILVEVSEVAFDMLLKGVQSVEVRELC